MHYTDKCCIHFIFWYTLKMRQFVIFIIILLWKIYILLLFSKFYEHVSERNDMSLNLLDADYSVNLGKTIKSIWGRT